MDLTSALKEVRRCANEELRLRKKAMKLSKLYLAAHKEHLAAQEQLTIARAALDELLPDAPKPSPAPVPAPKATIQSKVEDVPSPASLSRQQGLILD